MGTTSVVRVTGRSTKVELRGELGATLSVEGGDISRRADGTIDIAPSQSTVRIVCPEHSHVVLSTASGNVYVRGHVDDVKVITQSGSVDVERATDVDVRTTSGRVSIGCCVDTCRVVTKSGKVTVGAAHDVGVSTHSAKVEVGNTSIANVQTISGAVTVCCDAHGSVTARSMSGRIDITVPEGSPATMTLVSQSGRIRRDVTEGDGASLEVRTSSGAIRVASR